MDKHNPKVDELNHFRAEADKLFKTHVGNGMINWGRRHRATATVVAGAMLLITAISSAASVVFWQQKSRADRAYEGEKEVEAVIRKAVASRQKAAMRFPHVPSFKSDKAEDYHTQGLLCLSEKQMQEAEDYFRKSVCLGQEIAKVDSKDLKNRFKLGQSYLYSLGRVLEGTARPGEAEEYYRQAVSTLEDLLLEAPEDDHLFEYVQRTHLWMKHLFEESGQVLKAQQVDANSEAYYEKLADRVLSLNIPVLENNLAWRLAIGHEQCNPALAVKLSRAVLQSNPGEWTYWNTLGAAQYRAGDFHGAIEASHKCMDLGNGGDISNLCLLAMTYWRLGRHEEGITWRNRALQFLGKSASNLGSNWEESAALMAELINLVGPPLYWEDQRAFVESTAPAMLGRIAWLLATNPEDENRHTAFALQLTSRVVERIPTDADGWMIFAACQYRDENWQLANEALDKSIKLSEGGCDFQWLLLAMTHWRLGNRKQAREWYNKAILNESTPFSVPLRRLRDETAELLGLKDANIDGKVAKEAKTIDGHYAIREKKQDKLSRFRAEADELFKT